MSRTQHHETFPDLGNCHGPPGAYKLSQQTGFSGLQPTITIQGFVIWRNGRSSRNILLPTPDLPHGYYAEGPHGERCTIVKDAPSNDMKFCEDATFWERLDGNGDVLDKVLLLSCDPSRKSWNTVMGPLQDPSSRGSLWLYDIRDAAARPRRIALEGYPDGHDFHPLGLDIYPSSQHQPDDEGSGSGSGSGQRHSNLFVVNHARYNSTIEQFALSWQTPDRATWVRTISGPAADLVAPNALALTSPTSFYLTHDHRFTRRLPGLLGKTLPITESILALPLAWATHVNLALDDDDEMTTTTTVVASHIPFANGVAISPDGKRVAIASTTLCEIRFYERDVATQALELAASVPTPFAPDNVVFDEQGALVVAGHPHFQALVAVAANHTDAYAPSWVVSITPSTITSSSATGAEQGQDDAGVWDVGVPVPASRKVPRVPGYELRTLYQSDGSEFSSSSTGLRDSKTGVLYMVGLYEEGLMVCTP